MGDLSANACAYIVVASVPQIRVSDGEAIGTSEVLRQHSSRYTQVTEMALQQKVLISFSQMSLI